MNVKKLSREEFASEMSNYTFDYFITCASFEDRCLVTADLAKDKTKHQVIFYNGNEVNAIIDNANKLSSILGHSAKMIELNSDKPVDNYRKMAEVFLSPVFLNAKVLIDSTTFTHESLLVLLRLIVLQAEDLNNVFFSYVSAGEYSVDSASDEERWLSKGVKSIRSVIGYPGFSDPTKKNHLLIIVGFEFERTQKIIQEYEYDYVTLGFGKDSASILPAHFKLNFEKITKLTQDFPKSASVGFCLVDPFTACSEIISYLESPKVKNMNTVIAPMNNKISTIGAGLAAISNENIQIAYAKPNFYNWAKYSTAGQNVHFWSMGDWKSASAS
jgi:hypothetical protein